MRKRERENKRKEKKEKEIKRKILSATMYKKKPFLYTFDL